MTNLAITETNRKRRGSPHETHKFEVARHHADSDSYIKGEARVGLRYMGIEQP